MWNCHWLLVPIACPTTQYHIPDDLICSSTTLRTSYLAYIETWNGLIDVNCYINIELALVSFLLCSSFSKRNLEWICGKNVAMWSKHGRNHSSAQVVGRIIRIKEVCGVIRIKNVDRNLVFSVLTVHFDQNTSSTLIRTLNISMAYPCEVWNNCFCSYYITSYQVFVKNLCTYILIKWCYRTFCLVMCNFLIISELVFCVITIRLKFCSILRKFISITVY